MLQCFGAARALPVLKRFQPCFTTKRVRVEQTRTAPPHAREQFEAAVRDGWLQIHPPAPPESIQRIMDEVVGLSRADAELLGIAEAEGDDLFTDETLLLRAARKREVTAYSVTDAIALLRELNALNDAATRRLVFAIHAEDGRTFTAAELDALGIPGFL